MYLSPIPHRRRAAIVGLALVGSLALAACGGDDADDADESSADTVETTTPETTTPETTPETTTPETTTPETTTAETTAPETTDAAPAGYEDWCQAELELEQAISSEDGSGVPAAFESLSAAAPADVQDVTNRTIELANEFMAAGEDPSPEFYEAYGEVMDVVKAECGFAAIDVEATNYAFAGVPQTMDVGPVVITIDNIADEYHEIMVFRKNDGVTETAIELLSLPEDEAMSKVENFGGAFAPPGGIGHTIVDLVPGEYIALCMIPEGATEEAFAEAEATGVFPEGMPHAMHGMVSTFTVDG